MAHERGAAPGIPGHEFEVALGVRIGDPPPQDFDRHENRRERIIEFMGDFAGVKREGDKRGETGREHGANLGFGRGREQGRRLPTFR